MGECSGNYRLNRIGSYKIFTLTVIVIQILLFLCVLKEKASIIVLDPT